MGPIKTALMSTIIVDTALFQAMGESEPVLRTESGAWGKPRGPVVPKSELVIKLKMNPEIMKRMINFFLEMVINRIISFKIKTGNLSLQELYTFRIVLAKLCAIYSRSFDPCTSAIRWFSGENKNPFQGLFCSGDRDRTCDQSLNRRLLYRWATPEYLNSNFRSNSAESLVTSIFLLKNLLTTTHSPTFAPSLESSMYSLSNYSGICRA